MKNSVWLLVLGVLALVVTLDVAGVLPLGIFGGDTSDSASEDAMTVDGGEGDAASLVGRAKAAKDAEADKPRGLDISDQPSWKTRGSSRNGASIYGRVIVKETGQPLAGVQVELRRPDSMFHYLRAEPKGRYDLLVARTGTDGKFAFVDVKANNEYIVRCGKDGYAMGSTSTLDLRGGEREDVGDIALGPGGGMRGRVVDADGKPAPGTRVAISWRVQNNLQVILADPDTLPEIEQETKTDEDGRFEVAHIEAGDKTVIVKAPSGAAEVIRKITVVGDETVDAGEIKLTSNGTISGTIQYDDGTPVAGARIFAGPNQQSSLRTVSSAADGSFRVEWLPEGNHVVGSLVPGLPVRINMGVATGTDDLVVVFEKPASLSGVVVTQESGDPVPQFQISAEKKNIEDWQEKFVDAIVRKAVGPAGFQDAGGAFKLAPLSSGTYRLVVSAPGYPNHIVDDVAIAHGVAREGLRIELPQGNAVRGRVQASDGTPLGNARLYVFRQTLEEGMHPRDLVDFVEDRDPEASSRGDGSFELPRQSPGKIHVVAIHESGLPALKANVDVTAGDVDDIDLVLQPAGSVRGLLLGEGGRPAKNQQTYVLYPNGKAFRGWAAEDGRFELEMLPVGHCVVRWMSVRDVKRYKDVIGADDADAKRAAYDELRAEGGEHYIGAGQEVRVTLRLPRRVRFRGHLRVAGAPPVRSRGVWITIPEGIWQHWVECDENGYFETELESGKYNVWASGSKGDWSRDEIDIPDQATFTQDVKRD